MNVLLLGSGGRENALAWKIYQSSNLEKLYIAPGNAGTSAIAQNVGLNLSDFNKISEFIIKNKIDLLLIGPEQPLVEGIVDFFKENQLHKNLLIIGPDKISAQLESSKNFAKQFMQKYKIPTAKYFTATKNNIAEAINFMEKLSAPYVLKADGLAAGKGVLILSDIEEAKKELNNILNGKFGNAGNQVVIEEFLDGIECSVFILTDGKNYILLPEAKDYKRVGEGDTGLNTGGMGAISPVSFFNGEFKTKTIEKIIIPTINGIKTENFDYKGFIFFGLINVNNEPYVIEYNVRMGDPETEVVMPRIKTDFLQLLIKTAKQELADVVIDIAEENCCTVMLVSGGYPENYEKNKIITGLDNLSDSIIFHAATEIKEDKIYSSGGRVVAVTSIGKNLKEALLKSYKSIDSIYFEKMYYRKDIGYEFIDKK